MKGDLPKCKCGALARPNIMMFNDYGFNAEETSKQEDEFNKFMNKYVNAGKNIVMIEIGAGTAIPSIRAIGENIMQGVEKAELIRINPRESFGPNGIHSVEDFGLAGIESIV